jgi:serine/threonine protein kinase
MTLVTGRLTSGTLVYMSPEQIKGRDVDTRSDIYSLGIALYELLSGKPPFYQGDITHQHLKVAPVPLTDVSRLLNKIVLECLEKEKDKRFHSIEELRDSIKKSAEPNVDRNNNSRIDSKRQEELYTNLEELKAYWEQNEIEEAEKIIVRVLQLDPANKYARDILNEIERSFQMIKSISKSFVSSELAERKKIAERV